MPRDLRYTTQQARDLFNKYGYMPTDNFEFVGINKKYRVSRYKRSCNAPQLRRCARARPFRLKRLPQPHFLERLVFNYFIRKSCKTSTVRPKESPSESISTDTHTQDKI